MTVTLIWLIAFAVILFLTLKSWNGPCGHFIDRRIPKMLRSRDDRWVWCSALAIVGATLIINPVATLLTLLILFLIGWVVLKLIGWAMGRARTRK